MSMPHSGRGATRINRVSCGRGDSHSHKQVSGTLQGSVSPGGYSQHRNNARFFRIAVCVLVPDLELFNEEDLRTLRATHMPAQLQGLLEGRISRGSLARLK